MNVIRKFSMLRALALMVMALGLSEQCGRGANSGWFFQIADGGPLGASGVAGGRVFVQG